MVPVQSYINCSTGKRPSLHHSPITVNVVGLFAFSHLGNNLFSGIVATTTARQESTSLSEYQPSHDWRHIDSGCCSGARNMAIDEALLQSFNREQTLPVLRTYGWSPPALSLGRFQDAAEVLDLDLCRHDAVDIVRRVSGGGVIYHADELTYSIVCTQDQIPPATSVKDSFRVLTGFLIEFYRSLGMKAGYAVDAVPGHAGLGARTAFCFAGRESFDILIDGRKIGGNAQRRHRDIIFQHGSIPIVNRSLTGLQFMKDRNPSHAENSISLEDCGIPSDVAMLTESLVTAFRRHMEVETFEDNLTQVEMDVSQVLFENKYVSAQWNLKGELN